MKKKYDIQKLLEADYCNSIETVIQLFIKKIRQIIPSNPPTFFFQTSKFHSLQVHSSPTLLLTAYFQNPPSSLT